MFDTESRYYELETVTIDLPDGRTVAYKRRRFLPLTSENDVLAEHTVSQGERLDNITALYLGDPQLFWQLCDANDAMHPQEMTAEIGRKLRISLPQA